MRGHASFLTSGCVPFIAYSEHECNQSQLAAVCRIPATKAYQTT